MIYTNYAKIAGLHCGNYPELRIGQLMSNFAQWLKEQKKIDIFYLDDVRFVQLLEEHLKDGADNER